MNEILSFEDEAQAYAEIEAMGYHAMAFDFPAEENELHWHDFDSVLYVTGGELTVSVEGAQKLSPPREWCIASKPRGTARSLVFLCRSNH